MARRRRHDLLELLDRLNLAIAGQAVEQQVHKARLAIGEPSRRCSTSTPPPGVQIPHLSQEDTPIAIPRFDRSS